MPDETTTATTSTAPALRAFGWGCAALIAVPVLAVALLLAMLAWNSGGTTDYPRIAPEEMARRAFQHSQEAYDVLGFQRTVPPGVEKVGVSTENTLSSSYCWDDGPLGLDDKTVAGAYQMGHAWALDHVPASEAAPALRRLHAYLKDESWKISSYREGAQGQDWALYAERDDGAERMSFTWAPDSEYFTGGATAPCAYDPEWNSDDVTPSGGNQKPPVLAPHSG